MSDQKNRLTSLPVELIHEIFDHTQVSTQTLTAPLSKFLLPFQQRALFHTLLVSSYKTLAKLCSIAQSRPQLLLSTKILDTHIKLEDDSIIDAREAKDQNSPTVDAVKIFYRRLENVTTVQIFGTSRLALLLCNPDVATSSFSKMSYLHLASSFKPIDDPFCPALYFYLHRYTALSRLEVLVLRSHESIQPTALLPPPPHFLGSIIDFSLDGPISTSTDSVRCLLFAFGPLRALSLVDTAPTSRLSEILSGLDAPQHLRILALDHPSEEDSSPSLDLSDNFRSFSTLKTLILGGSCTSTESSFYTSLDYLPIDSLAFADGAEVSLPELNRVISGRAKHKNLSMIHFDHVQGKIGTRMDDETGPYWDDDEDKWSVHPDWLIPEWTEDFNEAGLIEFIELAEKEGVEVIGLAVEAIGVSEEYEKELAKLEVYRRGSDENE